ncbi:MAG: hypothetical protein K2O00_04625 [Muribaculaceae bacterium]|nr:hypothetical protein [Muribaculaceae bacterium]
MNEIPFTRLPTKLIFALDSDLVKMLALLIQQESLWKNKKQLSKNDSYYKSMDEFAQVFRRPNKQDVRLMLQTLQRYNFIEIIPNENKNQPNYYRICWNKIAEYNDIPIQELTESPMIETAKRTSKKKIKDSTVSYQQSKNDSTTSYQQDRDLIVQNCTTTIDNILNKNNNITIDNSEITKSPLYDEYKKRVEELLLDYQQESDYIVALDKFSNIESILKLATKHVPMSEIEVYNSQLSKASIAHERRGWNVLLDNITDDMMQRYHITNIHNVRTPSNPQQFKIILNDLLGKTDLYISSEYWEELTASIEKWIIHQWERCIISYDLQLEYIDKIYSKLAS